MGDASTVEPEDTDETVERDGRSLTLSTGAYDVQAHGNPDDDIGDLLEAMFKLADRAMEDTVDFDDRLDESADNRKYR